MRIIVLQSAPQHTTPLTNLMPQGIITSSYSFCEEKTYDRWGMELHPSYTSEFAKDFMKEHCKHMIMHHNHIKTVFIVEDMRTGKHYMLKEVLILQSLHKLPCTDEHDVLELVHADEEPGIAILGLSPKPDIFHELVKVSMVYPLYEMDLFNMIGYHTKKTKQEGLPMNVIVMYLAQMLEMLRRLRSKGVVHRDVKPENICVDGRGNLVLIDFEMAVQHDSNKFVDSSLVVGTIFYIAPESFKYREYSNLTDLWAVGVIACELYSAALPWDIRSGMSGPQILKILEETEPEKPTGMQDDLWQFLAKIFVDKNSRMTVEEAIRDPIFSKWCPGLNFARYGSKDEEMVTDLGNVFDQHDCLAEIRSLCEAKGLISQLQSKTTREKFNTLTKKNKSTNLRRDRILHQNSYFNDAIMYSLDSDSLRSESSGSNLKSGASQGTDGDSKE